MFFLGFIKQYVILSVILPYIVGKSLGKTNDSTVFAFVFSCGPEMSQKYSIYAKSE